MKLDYLSDVNSRYPEDSIIRLSEFSETEIQALIKTVEETLIRSDHGFQLEELSFVTAVDCSLYFGLSAVDVGIEQDGFRTYRCTISASSYQHLIDLLFPFTKNKDGGYQWLLDLGQPIDLLLSNDGTW